MGRASRTRAPRTGGPGAIALVAVNGVPDGPPLDPLEGRVRKASGSSRLPRDPAGEGEQRVASQGGLDLEGDPRKSRAFGRSGRKPPAWRHPAASRPVGGAESGRRLSSGSCSHLMGVVGGGPARGLRTEASGHGPAAPAGGEHQHPSHGCGDHLAPVEGEGPRHLPPCPAGRCSSIHQDGGSQTSSAGSSGGGPHPATGLQDGPHVGRLPEHMDTHHGGRGRSSPPARCSSSGQELRVHVP